MPPTQDDDSASFRVAVIIPVHNAAEFLADTLASVRAQTFTDWMCVVIDDGSSDATAQLARDAAVSDARISVLVQPNLGTPVARNNGLAAVPPSVPYVAFLDGDDIWLPDALETLVQKLSGRPSAVGAYGMAEYMDSNGASLRPGLHPARQRDRRRMGRFDLTGVPVDEPYTWSAMVVSGTLWPAGVALHRRAVVERVGGFDPALRQLQDWDLYIRMAHEGDFVPVERQVIWYRQHSSNVTSATDRVARYSLRVRQNAWRASAGHTAERRELRRVWRRLTARWTARSLQDVVRRFRAGDGSDAADAGRAALTFTRLFVIGHPGEPDEQTAHHLATRVMDAGPVAA